MQFPPDTPDILTAGGAGLFEKLDQCARMHSGLLTLWAKGKPLLLMAVAALHYIAWRHFSALKPEYGYAVLGMVIGLAAIVFLAHQKNPGSAARWADLGLRALYTVVVVWLTLDYLSQVYFPTLDYRQEAGVVRHLVAPALVSVWAFAFGLLLTCRMRGSSKHLVYALILAVGACWSAHYLNAENLALPARVTPAAAAAPAPSAEDKSEADVFAHSSQTLRSDDSVRSAADITALSAADSGESPNLHLKRRVKAEFNWCLMAAMAMFCIYFATVWGIHTWLDNHGVRSIDDFNRVAQFLKQYPLYRP